ncbi:MAG: very short patch repair endonuclease [Ruminococcaceae bacterium]|nr:very short patch repair endonuclease [Oscillospiraceae bacterium]
MDRHTPEQRRKNMQAIKNRDSKIELMLRKELWQRGLRYRKNVNKIYGKPDIAFLGKKIAVFCDGEFWHGFNWEERKNDLKSHQDFWVAKIERNMRRDKKVTEKLESEGWIVIRFWGNDIKNRLSYCGDIIQNAFESRK